MLMTALTAARLQNTPRQDSRAPRIVGCVAAKPELLSTTLRTDEELVTSALSPPTSAKPSCEIKCLQNVSAPLIAKRNPSAGPLLLATFNFITAHCPTRRKDSPAICLTLNTVLRRTTRSADRAHIDSANVFIF